MSDVVKGPLHRIDVDVGFRVRNARVVAGFSQSRLAEAVGITYQQIQKYETGKNRMSVSMLLATAKALNVNALDLLPEDDRPIHIGPAMSSAAVKVALGFDKLLQQSVRRAVLILTRVDEEEQANG